MTSILILTTLVTGLMLNHVSLADSLTTAQQRAMDYVLVSPRDCTLGDGFQCDPLSESEISLNQQQMIPAVYLRAWPVAYADFMQLDSIDKAQKQLSHYRIGFAEDRANFVVVFRALLLPELDVQGQATGRLMRTGLAPSLRYKIDKQSLEITERKLYR